MQPMKTRRTTILLTAWMYCLLLSAQRQLRVVDVETLVPVIGANVVTNDCTAQTDSLGIVSVSDSCRTLVFSHVNYESRLINLEEVRDTVFLISKLLNLKEVVVFGMAKHTDKYKELKKQLRMKKTEAQLMAANPQSGFNVLGLLGKLIPEKWKKSKKESRHERLKRILEEY